MASPSKTQGVAILAHQAITHPATIVGSSQNVTTKISCNVLLFHAPIEESANTNPGIFLIQTSGSSSGNEDWVTLYELAVDNGTAASEDMTATEPVGETVLACASTTGFAALDNLYIRDAGTLADSEWAKCKEIVTNTSIDLIDGLTNEKDSSDAIWNNCDLWNIPINLMGVGRLRVVFMHEGAVGVNCHVKALMVTADSVA